ncbi:MAG: hypothetical protein IJF04_07255 [Oscillospiraceae bacterium]|nr:hypothetical protein [Oscillospiraceae bacterium]MBQ2998689.1 hypothetical protein [Oscillospiraceae bacterium]
MVKGKNTFKKLSAMLLAMALIFCTAATAFADEVSGLELSEVEQAETGLEQYSNSSVDYSDLEFQVAKANGLYENDYTKESWSAVKEALNTGRTLLENGGSQTEVKEAADALDEAVDALVRMDYSRLEKALNEVYKKIEENPDLHDIWLKLNMAVEDARPMMINGDQDAVNRAAAEINALLDELEYIAPSGADVVVKEVEVEVPPSDDFCNIAGHKAWTALFVISFIINIGFLGMMAYILMKKRHTTDDIPLVNYNIDDDFDDMDDFEDFDDIDDIDDSKE